MRVYVYVCVWGGVYILYIYIYFFFYSPNKNPIVEIMASYLRNSRMCLCIIPANEGN